MKKIYWGLIIMGIIGSFISIYFASDHPLVMVGFFLAYLLISILIFTYYFDSIKIRQDIPELLSKEKVVQ